MGQKFKKTPIGEIPVDWEVKSLGELAECVAGGTPHTSVSEYWGGNIRWMNSGELNLKCVGEVEGRITEAGLKNSSAKLLSQKCVLIGLAGQGKTRGTVAMNLVELCTNQSIAAILPNAAFVPEFLYYNLDSRYGELRRLSGGEGGRGGLNLNIIRSLSIPLPPLTEQKKIAEILNSLDEALAKSRAVIEKTREANRGIIRNFFQKTAEERGNSTKTQRLGDLCELITKGTTPTSYGYQFTTSGVHFIKIENIDTLGRLVLDNSAFISEDTHRALNRSILREGDVLFSIAGALGRTAIITKEVLPANTNQALAIIRPKADAINPQYLHAFLNSEWMKRYARQMGTAGAQVNLSLKQVSDIPIPTPPISHQRMLSRVIDGLNREIVAEESAIAQDKTLRGALMQTLLSGRVRVKGDA